MYKIGQLGGFLGRLLAPSLKTGSHLIGNELKALAKGALIQQQHQQQIQLFIKRSLDLVIL